MSEIKAIEKLRKYNLCYQGEKYTFYDSANKIADEIEAEIAERYIKLPTDKNGNVIHIGDMVKHADGDVYEVLGVDNDGTRQGVFINVGDGRYPIDSWCASGMELNKSRTLEDVLTDVVTLCANTWKDGKSPFAFYNVSDVMESGNIREYADEIRELLGR